MADVNSTSQARWRSFFKKKNERSESSYSLTRRLRGIVALFAVGLCLLGARLVDLQVVRADTLADTAVQFRSRTYVDPAQRGQIVDSNGTVLATSRQRYNVAVNQNLVESYVRYDEDGEVVGRGVTAAAGVLAPILDMDEARLAGLLMGGDEKRTWVYLKRDVSPETWRKINSYGIPGIEPEAYMKREYPNGSTGASIIGFVGEDDSGDVGGQAGIERTLNETLTGEDGSLTVEISRTGAVIPSGRRIETPAEDGASVQLTIDADLQAELDRALQESVDTNSAEWGAAVAVEIGTGRVLAMSDSDQIDPNNPGAGGTAGSRAVQAPVEVGSTGKLVTFSSALDQDSVDPLTMFEVASSRTMPNGETISDNDAHPTENMTVAGILAKSYNTGLIQIGDTISDETRYDYMLKFGLGQPTGIEIPAESAGILAPVEDWGPRQRYTTMFGQSYAMTTVQLAQIAATIGNDGVREDLHLIDSITYADGTVEPTVVDDPVRVLSEDTATQMLGIMQAVTDPWATGYNARIEGYNVAGKTGTAQVADGSGGLTKRVGSFVGLVPAEDPQIAVVVIIYNGQGAGYGGDVAAPVFADFGAFAVRHLGIPPSTVPLARYPWTETELNEARETDNLKDDGSYVENPEG